MLIISEKSGFQISDVMVHVMQKAKYFFNCPTSNVKGQIIPVFRNHATFFIYICYCSGIIQSQKYMNWISDLFLQNDFKHRKAASYSNEFMWEFFFIPSSLSNFYFPISSYPILLNLYLNRWCDAQVVL